MQRSFRGSSMAWLVCKPAIVANCAAVLFKRLCRAASKFAKAVLVCPYPSWASAQEPSGFPDEYWNQT